MDPLSVFLYFGVPTTVGAVGLAAVKLHERGTPPYVELASASSGVTSNRSFPDIISDLAGKGASVSDVESLMDIGLEPPAIRGLIDNGIDLPTVLRVLNPREMSSVDRQVAKAIYNYLRFVPGDGTSGATFKATSSTEPPVGPETSRTKAG